jgi:hypothetical protein
LVFFFVASKASVDFHLARSVAFSWATAGDMHITIVVMNVSMLLIINPF